MGNNLCSGSRNCEPTNNVQFGMLCRRPCVRQLVIKFEKKNTYYKKRRKKKNQVKN